MVFKIMTPASASFACINYNEKKTEKGAAEKIKAIHFSTDNPTKDEALMVLKLQSSLNERIKNPVFHAVLSCKGDEYSHDELMKYAEEMMKQLGYAEQPILMYAHRDTNNNHIHIVTTRIDKKGKKINDSYEGKRANHILNSMMNRNEKMEFAANRHSAEQYRVSTAAQFNLLMEAAGYKVSKNKDTNEFVYYKNGEAQGKISEDEINKHIAETQAQQGTQTNATDKQRQRQIAAIVKKYAGRFDTTLTQSKLAGIYADEKSKWKSELTEELKKKFGLEFVFFSAKNGEKPYGYSIIDHSHKTVYKGGDVLKLTEFMNLQNSANSYNADAVKVSQNVHNDYRQVNSNNLPTKQNANETKQFNDKTTETPIESGFEPYDRDKSLARLINEIVEKNYNQHGKNAKQDDGTYKPEEENRKKRVKFY